MKSLEIVDSVIRVCKAEDTAIGLLYIEGLEQIKQDLEVLEIIRKKKVDIRELSVWVGSNLKIERALAFYNDSRSFDCRLTLEELLKLKQWLEVNENDRD